MMSLYKIILTGFLFIISSIVMKGQNYIVGNYKNNCQFVLEQLILKEDSTYIYSYSIFFTPILSYGTWSVRNDTLILNSKEQKMFDVTETVEERKKNFIKIEVLPDDFFSLRSIRLYVLTENGDTLIFKNLDDRIIKIRNKKINSIYVKNELHNIKSSNYYIKNSSTNSIKIIFKNILIFKDEKWLIYDDFLIPITQIENIDEHTLKKKDESSNQ